MARHLESSDRDLSANYDKAKSNLFRLMDEPPATLEDAFDSPAVRERIARSIVNAIRKSEWN